MECTLHDSLEVHDKLMILGDIQHVHVDDELFDEGDGKLDLRNLPTVGRLGGPYYTASDPVEFERQF